jgi:hypothetical protein
MAEKSTPNPICERTFDDLGLTFGDAISDDSEAKPFKELITNHVDCFAMDKS